jgi:hypothetical protein
MGINLAIATSGYCSIAILCAVCVIGSIALNMYRRVEMVDINSGRVKQVIYVCDYPVNCETRETWVLKHTSFVATSDNWKVATDFRLAHPFQPFSLSHCDFPDRRVAEPRADNSF